VAERKRESIMGGLSQTKGQVSGLEAALARSQTELEKAQFELGAAKGAPAPPRSMPLPARQGSSRAPGRRWIQAASCMPANTCRAGFTWLYKPA